VILELSEHLREHLPRGGRGAFDAVLALEGETYRRHKHRHTFRCEIGGRDYFVKIHRHTGWREILKNVLRLRIPTLTARPEREAIRRLESLGVATVRAAGYGVRGRNPARLESFIITEALGGMMHLDDAAREWAGLAPARRRRRHRRAIRELAIIARAMHGDGLNHRDFYLNHFMLPRREWRAIGRDEPLDLHVIDLHRVQIRDRTPPRWIAKDLSGLLFSSFDAGLESRDALRFLRVYWGGAWRDRLRRERLYLRHIIRRAVRLYRSERGRRPRLPVGLASF